TRDDIALRLKEDMQASLAQVIPASLHDNDILANPLTVNDPNGLPVTVYRGAMGARVNALAWEVVGQGYAGDIRLLMGLNANGEILGVRVIAHAETPGLGDKIEINRNDWILGFNGLSLGNTPQAQWAVDKDGGRFDAFSGATITPRAVVGAVKKGLDWFQANRTAIVNAPMVTTPVMEE
ncbi:MAG: RnfABCDGE type electron transport complex subunit G, partial [Gammaproteobacteria bacterium]|nr:RnfABCDGE type electron transport complex subunit G [Gammaproteobacteria bacterium]